MRRITEAAARRHFIEALERLDHVEGSPLRVLKEAFLLPWRDATHPTSRVGGYISADEKRMREHEGRRVLQEWAKACRLVSVDKDGKRTYVDWLVDYARIVCEQHEASRSNSPNFKVGLYPPLFETELPPAKVVRMSPPWLWYPPPEPDEKWVQYKRRACDGLKKHWKACQIGPGGLAAVKQIGGTATTTENANKYEWLVLYQCCNWTLKEIGARPGEDVRGRQSADQTIYQGIHFAAQRSGLIVMRRRTSLKRSRN